MALSGKLSHISWKLLYLVHYRFLFGRAYPGSAWVARGLREWEWRTGRGDVPVPREEWERQYAGGGWEFLRGTDELARYGVLTAYLHHLHPGGSVLDVGCGEGLLRDRLAPLGYSRFVGVDLSAAAVEAASRRPDPLATFEAVDAERYTPSGRFDAVVFNECLYYFEDPIGAVRRYRPSLEEGGTLIVSMFRSRRAAAIQRQLEAELALLEKVAVSNRKGTWVVSLFR
jgi:2-polyprenyl-3-methyl-5-hydroxy-6-metoxy-1,4-benzoquinol methylase